MQLSVLFEHDNLAIYPITTPKELKVAGNFFPMEETLASHPWILDIVEPGSSSRSKLYLLLTDTGPFLAVQEPAGDKGYLIDSAGDQAIFEDILMVHPEVNWASARDMLALMIKIDPCLPFDLEMTAADAYQIAIDQFPLVLDEDREIPEDLLDQVTIPE